MKKYFFLACFAPALAMAQVKKFKAPVSTKKPAVAKLKTADGLAKPVNGFRIQGTVSGVADGTVIQMLNINTGAQEHAAQVEKGKFSFTGNVTTPEFKLLTIAGEQPGLNIFLDNSDITLNATKEAFANAEIKGSSSQNDFAAFTAATKGYEDLIMGKGRFETSAMDGVAAAIEKYVDMHRQSFFSPIAIYKYSSITGDNEKLEEMYNKLSAPVQQSPVGAYIEQLVAQYKSIPYGQPLADFTEPDTAGNNISLASFKGKYVLVDFWASWCGPCRAENPNVANIFEKFKDKNFTVLGVSLDRAKQPWVDAIAMDHLTWTHVSDLKFWGNAAAVQFGIQGIPANFLLDPQGNLIGKNLRGAALEYKLSKVLK